MSYRIFASPFSTTKSMSDSCKLTLLETWKPLKKNNADLSSAKDTFARIHDMLVAQLSPFFLAASSLTPWYRLRPITYIPFLKPKIPFR